MNPEKAKSFSLVTGFFVLFVIAWYLFAESINSVLIPTPLNTFAALIKLIFEGATWKAFWLSNQSLLIGFFLAVVVGVVIGLMIGRVQWMEQAFNPWLTLLLVLPMSMMMPMIIMAFGFSLAARVFIVFIFAMPTIIVNTRAGIREVPQELIEMGRVFGANEVDLWRHILVKSAAPSMWAGIRIGLGRSITGMMLGELLLVAVGIGVLFKVFQGQFDPDKTFGLVGLLIAESLILMKICRSIERRLIPWFYVSKFENK